MKRKLITGVELASYIQILASDKQTCILRLQQQGQIGVLSMRNGDLLDAQTRKRNDSGYSSRYKEDAVIEMLRWERPEIELLPFHTPIKKKINKSLQFLLLESCRFQDEEREDEIEKPFILEDQQFSDGIPFDDMSIFINDLQQNKNIAAYLIVDIQGNIVIKKDEENILDANFLSFVQFTLNAYNPEILPHTHHAIHFTLANNRTIMIYSLQSIVLGLVVNSQVAFEKVEKHIPPLLSYLQTSEPNTVTSVSL